MGWDRLHVPFAEHPMGSFGSGQRVALEQGLVDLVATHAPARVPRVHACLEMHATFQSAKAT